MSFACQSGQGEEAIGVANQLLYNYRPYQNRTHVSRTWFGREACCKVFFTLSLPRVMPIITPRFRSSRYCKLICPNEGGPKASRMTVCQRELSVQDDPNRSFSRRMSPSHLSKIVGGNSTGGKIELSTRQAEIPEDGTGGDLWLTAVLT